MSTLKLKSFQGEKLKLAANITIPEITKMVRFDKRLIDSSLLENFGESELDDLSNFREFDNNSMEDYFTVGFLLDDNYVSDELYYIKKGGSGFGKIPFTFDTCIDKMIPSKGFMEWQLNVLLNDSSNFIRMQHYLKQIF